MLRSLSALIGYYVRCEDKDAGSVYDIYFDSRTWTMRYFVVDTGNWLSGRKVLVSPAAVADSPDWKNSLISLRLSKEQVDKSPEIDLHQPISVRKEKEIATYYSWPVYWAQEGLHPTGGAQLATPPKTTPAPERDSHLRSLKEVRGYHVSATDGNIGHVEDLILDDHHWDIRYLVVDTRNWLPGKMVLVAPSWVKDFNWAESLAEMEVNREKIEDSPEYDPAQPINRELEEQLYDYYGRPHYWTIGEST